MTGDRRNDQDAHTAVAALEFGRPHTLEIAAGAMLGSEPSVPTIARGAGAGRSVRQALELELLAALQHSPCLVAFSGGRDSSAILALAVHVARRQGLPEPVAITMRYPGIESADENEWQQLVIDRLGVTDWQCLHVDDDLDFIGPVARRFHDEVGLVFPANAYLSLPMAEAAAGGALVTGVGGDELLGSSAPRWFVVARHRQRPRRRDLAAWIELAPSPVRRRRDLRRLLAFAPWLTDDARRAVAARLATSDMSLRWDRALRRWPRERYLAGLRSGLAALGAVGGCQTVSPFLAPPVLAAAADTVGFAGFASRTDAMAHLFADLLPEATVARPTKATFTPILVGDRTRAFAAEWDGAGVDPALVDADVLARVWPTGELAMPSALLLQQAAFRN